MKKLEVKDLKENFFEAIGKESKAYATYIFSDELNCAL